MNRVANAGKAPAVHCFGLEKKSGIVNVGIGCIDRLYMPEHRLRAEYPDGMSEPLYVMILAKRGPVVEGA